MFQLIRKDSAANVFCAHLHSANFSTALSELRIYILHHITKQTGTIYLIAKHRCKSMFLEVCSQPISERTATTCNDKSRRMFGSPTSNILKLSKGKILAIPFLRWPDNT